MKSNAKYYQRTSSVLDYIAISQFEHMWRSEVLAGREKSGHFIPQKKKFWLTLRSRNLVDGGSRGRSRVVAEAFVIGVPGDLSRVLEGVLWRRSRRGPRSRPIPLLLLPAPAAVRALLQVLVRPLVQAAVGAAKVPKPGNKIPLTLPTPVARRALLAVPGPG